MKGKKVLLVVTPSVGPALLFQKPRHRPNVATDHLLVDRIDLFLSKLKTLFLHPKASRRSIDNFDADNVSLKENVFKSYLIGGHFLQELGYVG